MNVPLRLACVVAVTLAFGAAQPAAQSRTSLAIRVAETAGIRRSTYPASARVRFQPRALADAAHARLLLNGREVAAQFAAESSYADGSVQWLTADFNVSLGPRETAEYLLEYGDNVKQDVEARGLSVGQDADGIQIGSVRLSPTGAPLVLSVKYRREIIGTGANGFSIVDAAGNMHDATGALQRKVELVKRGPFSVVVRYTGQLPLTADYAVGYATTVEMPNSKSWMKITTIIADPEKRVRELSFHTPLALGAQPWTWDLEREAGRTGFCAPAATRSRSSNPSASPSPPNGRSDPGRKGRSRYTK